MNSKKYRTTGAICLNSTQAISFEINLIGCISNYYLKIIQALQAMCNKGMGHPPKRFILQTVEEISCDGKKNLLFADDKLCAKTLLFPITYSDYLKKYGDAHDSAGKNVIDTTLLKTILLVDIPAPKKNKYIENLAFDEATIEYELQRLNNLVMRKKQNITIFPVSRQGHNVGRKKNATAPSSVPYGTECAFGNP
jgi:hypothetical protein